MSIVVVLFNMEREGRRTLYSLSTRYQVGIRSQDYEVIVVDNGSVPPFSADYVASLGEQFRYVYIADASPSPAAALNRGIDQCRGQYIATMIDGARVLTPGTISYALRAFRAFDDAVVTPPAWHVGADLQRRAVSRGYCREVEDKLFERIRWPEDGYRLFEISTLAGSCKDGWLGPMWESTCLFTSRKSYERIGGYDERFDAPGGGLLNQDTYRRLCSLEGTELVVLLGEGTFHQLHDGVSTNTSEESFRETYRMWCDQYRALRGESIAPPEKRAHFIGHVPPQARKFLLSSAESPLLGEEARTEGGGA